MYQLLAHRKVEKRDEMNKWQSEFPHNRMGGAHKREIAIVAYREYDNGAFVVEYNSYGYVVWHNDKKQKHGYRSVSHHKTLKSAKQKCDNIIKKSEVNYLFPRRYGIA